ncbi:MAG: hypothetical protein VX642_12950 [Bdellovibrionota bacterium]|nr:hypothetical protein [Bdellovibrionota bacterium]
MKQNKYFLSLMSGVMLLGVACAKDIDKKEIATKKDGNSTETKAEPAKKINTSAEVDDLAKKSETASTDIDVETREDKKKPVIKYRMPIVTNYKLAREVEKSLNKENSEKLSEVVLESLRNSLQASDRPASLITELKCEFKVLELEHRSLKKSIQFSDDKVKKAEELKSLSPYLLARDKKNQNLIDIYLLDNKLDSSIPYDMRLGIECIGGGDIVEFEIRSFIDSSDSIEISKDSIKSIEFKGTDITGLQGEEASAKVAESYKSARALLKDSYTGVSEFVNMKQISYEQIMSLMQFVGTMSPKYDASIPDKEALCDQIEQDLDVAEDYEHLQEMERLKAELEVCDNELREMKGLDEKGNDLLKAYKAKVAVQIEEPTKMYELIQMNWAAVKLYAEKSHREILESTDVNVKLSLDEAKKEQAPPANYKGPEFEEISFETGKSFWETLEGYMKYLPTTYPPGIHYTF